jgi:hypothetical protein
MALTPGFLCELLYSKYTFLPRKAVYHDLTPLSSEAYLSIAQRFLRGLSLMSRRIEKAATSSLITSALDRSLLLIIQIGEVTNLGVLKGASSRDVVFGLLIR